MIKDLVIVLLLLFGTSSALILAGADYSIDKVHYGLQGNNATGADYSLRQTFTYQQPSGNATGADYSSNVGWFNVTIKTVTPSNPVNATIDSVTNMSNKHAFILNASVDDADGGTNIAISNSSSTFGSCVQLSNSTSGNTFNISYNCSTKSPGETTVIIGFKDSTTLYNETSPVNNTYPDHAATLGAPTITPDPANTNSDLTCTEGSFSDVDGDTENTSAREWVWYKNSAVIVGETTTSLESGNFTAGDTIICQQFAIANNWTDSNDTTNSTVLTIQNEGPVNGTLDSITNGSASHSFIVNASVVDIDGGTDVNETNISVSFGSCTQVSNTTGGNYFNVSYNCSASSPGNTSIQVGFTDTGSNYNETNVSNNSYIDHALTLGAPTIAPVPTEYSSNITCTAGSFTDIDGDVENTSARVWAWYLNGSVIAGETNNVLGIGNYSVGDTVNCQEFATADNWTTSNDTTNSSNVTIVANQLVITLSTGITEIRYSPIHGLQTNVSPVNQTENVSLFTVTNNASVVYNISMYLNDSNVNISTWCSPYYNGTNALTLNTSVQFLFNVTNGTNSSVYCWANYSNPNQIFTPKYRFEADST